MNAAVRCIGAERRARSQQASRRGAAALHDIARRRVLRWMVAVAMACGAGGAYGADATLDFELSTLGGRTVTLSALAPQPTLVNFWRSDCPPCIRELPLLSRFAQSTAALRVFGVALQSRAETEAQLAATPLAFAVLLGPPDARDTLREWGDTAGAIPHTVVLNADRTVCARRTGEVDQAWLDRVVDACGGAALPPSRSAMR
jgi:thiol-disulfide isomerase/thioredoxin